MFYTRLHHYHIGVWRLTMETRQCGTAGFEKGTVLATRVWLSNVQTGNICIPESLRLSGSVALWLRTLKKIRWIQNKSVILILFSGSEKCEVPSLCRTLLGRWAEVVAHIFSLLVLTGANIVYWILISNFLYFTVNYLLGKFKRVL